MLVLTRVLVYHNAQNEKCQVWGFCECSNDLHRSIKDASYTVTRPDMVFYSLRHNVLTQVLKITPCRMVKRYGQRIIRIRRPPSNHNSTNPKTSTSPPKCSQIINNTRLQSFTVYKVSKTGYKWTLNGIAFSCSNARVNHNELRIMFGFLVPSYSPDTSIKLQESLPSRANMSLQ